MELINATVRQIHNQQLVEKDGVEWRQVLDTNKSAAVFIPFRRIFLMVILAQPLQKCEIFIRFRTSKVLQVDLMLRLPRCWRCEGLGSRVRPCDLHGGKLKYHLRFQGMHVF